MKKKMTLKAFERAIAEHPERFVGEIFVDKLGRRFFCKAVDNKNKCLVGWFIEPLTVGA